MSFAEKFGFEILFLDYFGGIHPGGLKLLKKNRIKPMEPRRDFFF